MMRAMTPMGTLTPKTQRHPTVATRAPPMVGPSASPRAWPAAWMPRAGRILPGGALVVTRATLLACMRAAPSGLHGAEGDEGGQGGGESAGGGGGGEHGEAVEVHELAAAGVGEAAAWGRAARPG